MANPAGTRGQVTRARLLSAALESFAAKGYHWTTTALLAERTGINDFLKSHYLFTFSLIYLVTLIILAGLINIWFKEFSFLKFLSLASRQAADIFTAVFRQVFL